MNLRLFPMYLDPRWNTSHLPDVGVCHYVVLQVAMKIIESYILLGKADFLRLHAAGVVKIFDIVIGNVKERGMLCTLPVMDLLIQVEKLHQLLVG